MTMLPSMVAFRGDLSIFNVLDIIQLVHSSQKTGRLRVFSPDQKDTGEIVFNNGRIVSAHCEVSTDEGAVHHLLRIRSGSFEFLPSLNPFQVRIHLSTPRLLMQCLKQLDEEGVSLLPQPA